jgi:glycosyltransferase involved in cell wall biosynthesis
MSNVALIAHHFWNRAGGGELVCASFAKVFESIGFEPVLASTVRIDVSRYPEWFGIELSRYKKIDLGMELKAFGIYLRLLQSSVIKKAVKIFKPSIVFLDTPTYKRALKTITSFDCKLIEYIHFPQETWFMKEFPEFYYKTDPYLAERYRRIPMNIYFWLFTKLLKLEVRDNPFRVADLVLANSKWTADLVKSIYGESPTVLNPPLPPTVEVVEKLRTFDERDNVVTMVGRFSEEKRYHWVVREVFPRLRKELGNVKLLIFGATRTKTAKAYYNRVLEYTKSFEKDVQLFENAPRSTINEALDRARAFLHATVNEHWGVAVAEAMARGLPVVVHKSGGAWSNLASEGLYGLGYTKAEEAAEAIVRLLTDGKVWKYFSEKSIEKAKTLTFSKFIENASNIVKKIL